MNIQLEGHGINILKVLAEIALLHLLGLIAAQKTKCDAMAFVGSFISRKVTITTCYSY